MDETASFDAKTLKRICSRASSFAFVALLHGGAALLLAGVSALMLVVYVVEGNAPASLFMQLFGSALTLTVFMAYLTAQLWTARREAGALRTAEDLIDIEGHLVAAIDAERRYWTVFAVLVWLGVAGLAVGLGYGALLFLRVL